MPKSYEQEVLEIESARISADLAYHREIEILNNKPLYSKKQVDDLERKLNFQWGVTVLIAILITAFITYLFCHQSS